MEEKVKCDAFMVKGLRTENPQKTKRLFMQMVYDSRAVTSPETGPK